MSYPKREKYSMQTNDRLEDTARWLRYAKEDLVTAEILFKAVTPFAASSLLVGTPNYRKSTQGES